MMLKLDNGKNVFLDFVRNGSDVSIAAYDRNGKIVSGGYLVVFETYGTLRLEGGISTRIGLSLDIERRIVLS